MFESLVNHLVSKHFDARPRPGWSDTEVFFFTVRGRGNNTFRYEFYRPCNYTAVFVRRMLDWNNRNPIWSRPYLIQYHDSCWRQWFSEAGRKTEPVFVDDLGLKGMGTMDVDPKEYTKYLNRDEYRFNEEVKKEVFDE